MKVIIAAGGSGGHIFPAIAVARVIELKEPASEMLFVGGGKSLDRRIFEKEGFKFTLLSANKLSSKGFFKILPFLFGLVVDLCRAFSIIFTYKPDVVAGFGGYVSFPVVCAAAAMRIPVVVHEQNVVPGRANKLLFAFAAKIALSFAETKRLLPAGALSKSVVTGNPLRADVLKDDREGGRKRYGLDPEKCTILVIGGSQGAHVLNETFIAAVAGFDEKMRTAVQVIHITGVKDYEHAVRAYASTGIEHRVHSFIDRIEEAYSAADLVVTRSGASALCEVASFGRAIIAVPYPYAKSHQLENAKVFSSKGAAVIAEEKTLTPDMLRGMIMRLVSDRSALAALGSAAKRLSTPNAALRCAEEVFHAARR